jgi:uncharacterized protein
MHTFQQGDQFFCADTNSGAVHILDALSYALLTRLTPPLPDVCPQAALDALTAEGYSAADVAEVYAELRALAAAGTLFSEDTSEAFAEALQPAPLKSMCLNIAHDCNLRCTYCFAAQGDFGTGRRLMPFSVAKAAVDFLLAHCGGRRNLELDFFGGEPLMNWDVVKQTVTYAKAQAAAVGKRFRFTITTNGLLLDDEKIAYINAEMANVVLSLDGRRAVHDRMRPTPNGQPSYDLIVPKYQKLVAERGDKEYYVRGTFTRENLDFATDVLHMAELGFPNLSMEPAVLDEAVPYALREEDLPVLFAEYERLTGLLAVRPDVRFFHFLLDLGQGPCVLKRLRGCSCGNEYCAVTPEGDIYPCHQFVGLDDWKMGSVLTGAWDAARQAELVHAHLYHKPECRECWAKFYCGGGCNAANVLYQGTLLRPTPLGCALERKRVECAIALAGMRDAQ